MKCSRCQHENPSASKVLRGVRRSARAHLRELRHSLLRNNKVLPRMRASGSRSVELRKALSSPETYTPKHLAEKILTSKSALEGERKQVTVLFADMKGSMELLADRDPEEATKTTRSGA